MAGIYLIVGCFVGSMIYSTIRDRQFFKRFRYTTLEGEKLARSMSFTPLSNFIDSVIVTAVVAMIYMAYLQLTHQIP